jgi:hypothetical protein
LARRAARIDDDDFAPCTVDLAQATSTFTFSHPSLSLSIHANDLPTRRPPTSQPQKGIKLFGAQCSFNFEGMQIETLKLNYEKI